MFYVYCYLDPRFPGKFKYGEFEFNYKPFYIGKGKGKRCIRALEPNELKKQNRTIKRNYLESLYKNGYSPIVLKLYENILENDAFDKEMYLIKTIGRIKDSTGPLTNISDGGDGYSGFKHSEKVKEKISKIHKGRKLTEEHKSLLSIKNKEALTKKGGKFTEEHIEKLKKANSRPRGPMSDNSKIARCNKYLITSPEGVEHEVSNIAEFCNKNNISVKEMRRIAHKNKTYQGWKCIKITDKYKRG